MVPPLDTLFLGYCSGPFQLDPSSEAQQTVRSSLLVLELVWVENNGIMRLHLLSCLQVM